MKIWVLVILVSSGILGAVFVAMQQNIRQEANEVLVQMAEDLARWIGFEGKYSTGWFLDGTVDPSVSLSPFILVFDDQGVVQASTTQIDGKTPVLPSGVLEYAKAHGQNRVTWAPKPGLRLATVTVWFDGAKKGYVTVGRSLREVEKRIDMVTRLVIGTWLATIVGSGMGLWLVTKPTKK